MPVPLDFNQLADRAADPGNLAASATIKKEILHYDILLAMHAAGLLAQPHLRAGTGQVKATGWRTRAGTLDASASICGRLSTTHRDVADR